MAFAIMRAKKLNSMGTVAAALQHCYRDRETPNGLQSALQLHARALRLPHPSGGVLKVIAPLPKHMLAAFDMLGFSASEARDPFAPFDGGK